MGIAFGVVAAILLGASDVAAAVASRKAASISVTRTALMTSICVALIGLLIVPSVWSVRDVAVGALSGITMTTGLTMLYRAYSLTRVGVVAPTTSVLTALIPVVVVLVRGDVPSAVAAAGMALGLVGIGLATYEPSEQNAAQTTALGAESAAARTGLLLGLAAGLCFGFGFALLAETSNESGLVPVVIQRSVGLAGLLLIGLRQSAPMWALKPEVRKTALYVGLFAGVAMCFLKLGFRRGPDGPVAVAVSQFATAAVVFAVVFTKERLRRIAGIGIALSAVGVAMMSLG
jgi:drug/metabolite transporter (DMT)-like permease